MLGHATMSLQRGKVDSEGKLQLPAEMRRALSLSDGDTVLLEMVGGEIHVRPLRDVVSRVRARLREYVAPDVSLAEEPIADRRTQAGDE